MNSRTSASTARDVPIASITIGDRYRRDPGDLTELAGSIRDVGLISPITITAENLLIAGERRLLACRDVLGWDRIPVYVISTPSLLRCEWAENEIRKAFTVSERVALADAITAEVENAGERRGRPSNVVDLANARDEKNPGHGPEIASGTETRDHVAEVAGFDSSRQLQRARTVLEKGAPELRDAVDREEVSLRAAVDLTNLDHDAQRAALKGGRFNVIEAAKQFRAKQRDDDEALVPRVRTLKAIADGEFPCLIPGCARGPENPFTNAGSLGNHRLTAHYIRSTNFESMARSQRRDRERELDEARKTPRVITRPDSRGIRPGALDTGDLESLRRLVVNFITGAVPQIKRTGEQIRISVYELCDPASDLSRKRGTAGIGAVNPDDTFATASR